MASKEETNFNVAHAPHPNAIEAFTVVEEKLKHEVLRSRSQWNKHEPRMWAAAEGLDDKQLVAFNVAKDLVLVRSSPVSYGTIILGKIRIPDIADGHIHVRIHDPPNRGEEDVTFHSIWTDEGPVGEDGKHAHWNAIHPLQKPLEFFNE